MRQSAMHHFLSIADFSADELWQFLYKAIELKDELKAGGNRPILQGKILGMLFQKPSLRTRVSFERDGHARSQIGAQPPPRGRRRGDRLHDED